jgi:hypothetical protein
LRGGIVGHPDQVELLASSFQPVVFTGVPLHQLSIGCDVLESERSGGAGKA